MYTHRDLARGAMDKRNKGADGENSTEGGLKLHGNFRANFLRMYSGSEHIL